MNRRIPCPVRALCSGICLLTTTWAAAAPPDRHRTWEVYNGGPEAMKYSALDQINRGNVKQLAVAWIHRSGDADAGSGLSALQSNPVVVRGTMYLLGQNNKVIALDAATGRQLWVHRSTARGTATRRGLVYWENSARTDRRLFFTVGPNLLALDADNGTPIRTFGKDGAVTLYVDRDSSRTAGAPSPGIIFEDLLIMGSVVGEMYGGAPGNIRAYDVRSGELRWVFRTVPRPGEFGHDTWSPDSWKRNGGANVWGAFSVDRQRGIVFAPTGSPSYDFYGADRKGENLFGNCVLALDARTGKRIWHYQVVHHDLWDYDLSAQPLLATLPIRGKPTDAVIQVTKHGFVFVLDRETGKPLFPVEERPVPASDVPGEEAWPTQPFPLRPAPVARQRLTLADLTTFPGAEERKALRETFRTARNEGLFTPPSERGTISSPGHNGGPLWGGGAYDPETGMFYVSTHDQPSYFKLTRVPTPAATTPFARGRQIYRANCAVCHGNTGAGVKEVMAPLMKADAGRPAAEIPDLGARFDPVSFRDAVKLGKGRMPPSTQLSDGDVELVSDYVRRIREPAAQEPDATPDPTANEGELRFTTPWTFFRDSAQLPAVKPPWGRLVAIDMKTGRTAWRQLIGTEEVLAKKGIAPTGHKYLKGGPVVTAGGLIFMAGTLDRSLRAFDKRTGRLLWTGALPFDSVAIPAIYEVGGKQFIAITAMAGREGKHGDAVVAFALPDQR
jgi:quinoprotein glucose dehydrogenase